MHLSLPMTARYKPVTLPLLMFLLVPWPTARAADVPARRGFIRSGAEAETAPRLISRREVFDAIRNELARRGIAGPPDLRPDDFNLQTARATSKSDVDLEVRKIDFDPSRRKVVFELWAAGEPQYLPFDVTTRRDPADFGLQVASLATSPRNNEGGVKPEKPALGAAGSKPAILAKPGQPVTLTLLGKNVRIVMTVVPLQPGSKGQSILVRDVATARVITALVVDERLLTASF